MQNYCKQKNGRIKIGGYKGGRGYMGYHTTFDNKSVFLRSLLEYFIAKQLDHNKEYYLVEQMIYNINDINYKPDFFVYSDDTYSKLIKIIEVKSSKQEYDLYNNLYKSYFNNIGIQYITLGNKIDIRKQYDFITRLEIDNWKKKYIENYNIIDYSGKNNPMFGMKHSENTRIKIGLKTKQYMSDPVVKTKHSNSLKNFWKSEEAILLKEKYKKLRQQEYENRQHILTETDPFETRICVICQNTFEVRTSSDRCTCINNKCSHVYNAKHNLVIKKNYNAVFNYQQKLINMIRKIDQEIFEYNFNDLILKYKQLKIFPRNFGVSVNTIMKYFNSFDEFKEKIKNG